MDLPPRETPWRTRLGRRPWPVRVFSAGALLCFVGTFVAAQVDYYLRHKPLIDPRAFWLPQLRQVWAPGLGATAVLGGVALAAHVISRRRQTPRGA